MSRSCSCCLYHNREGRSWEISKTSRKNEQGIRFGKMEITEVKKGLKKHGETPSQKVAMVVEEGAGISTPSSIRSHYIQSRKSSPIQSLSKLSPTFLLLFSLFPTPSYSIPQPATSFDPQNPAIVIDTTPQPTTLPDGTVISIITTTTPTPNSTSSSSSSSSKTTTILVIVLVVASVLLLLSGGLYFHRRRRRIAAQLAARESLTIIPPSSDSFISYHKQSHPTSWRKETGTPGSISSSGSELMDMPTFLSRHGSMVTFPHSPSMASPSHTKASPSLHTLPIQPPSPAYTTFSHRTTATQDSRFSYASLPLSYASSTLAPRPGPSPTPILITRTQPRDSKINGVTPVTPMSMFAGQGGGGGGRKMKRWSAMTSATTATTGTTGTVESQVLVGEARVVGVGRMRTSGVCSPGMRSPGLPSWPPVAELEASAEGGIQESVREVSVRGSTTARGSMKEAIQVASPQREIRKGAGRGGGAGGAVIAMEMI